MSRRKIFKGAVGVAIAGAAGGSVVTEAGAGPASAATGMALLAGQATTVEQGGVAPTVVSLTDAPTITVDASLGNDFRVTITANRTMGNPSNAVDGQKIVFQITQGAGGAHTLSWGNSYELPTGPPQPTLSREAGQTDLLVFVYNAAIGNWLLSAFVNGFSPTTSTSSTTYRLFPSTTGPASANSYNGDWLAGVSFEVTTGGMWFEGYWWWVCDSGQQTDPQRFALWEVTSNSTGILMPGTTVTSGTLTPGQWNFVPLATPIQLSLGTGYMAVTGYVSTSGFPITQSQFGNGQPFGNGITNGPLFGYPSPGPHSVAQGAFSASAADPASAMPDNSFNSSNFWMDVQVSDTAPVGYAGSYRLWPNQPYPENWLGDSPPNNWTLGTEFFLSTACALDNIWFYSPSGTSQLPTECGIWNVASQTLVPDTHNPSPSWSGAAGSGWISCSYSGVTLPSGDYKVTVFNGAATVDTWSATTFPYWSSPGVAVNGIVNGPLSAPNDATATNPGQSTYQQDTSFSYPETYSARIGSPTYWVDVEVTPKAS